MTTFLDYYKVGDEILFIGIRTDGGIYKGFNKEQFDQAVAYLMGTELIVTFKAPLTNLKKTLVEYEHYLDDQNLSKRWTDLANIIRKESGMSTTLKQLAIGTLGEGPQSHITRLEESIDPRDRYDIYEQIESKLSALQQIWNYAVLNDQVSFMKGNEYIWVELTINENP